MIPEDPPNDSNATARSNASSVEQLAPTLKWIPSEPGRAVLWIVAIATVAGLLYAGWRFVGTVVMGVFVYYVTRPVFRRVNTRIRPRTIAVAVTLLTAVLRKFKAKSSRFSAGRMSTLPFITGWAFATLIGSLTDLLESDVVGEFEMAE